MSTYQIQMAQIGADGSQNNMYPKNRDYDTIISANVYGNKTTASLYTALNTLYNKFSNYYTTADTVNKATSATYATSFSDVAEKVTSSTYATLAENADSASKAKYDINMKPITSYLSTADLSTDVNSSNQNGRVVVNETFANKAYTEINNKFANYYTTADTVNKATSADLADKTYKDAANRVLQTYYLKKSDKGTSATTAIYSNIATHSQRSFSADNATYDNNNQSLLNQVELITTGSVNVGAPYSGAVKIPNTPLDLDDGFLIILGVLTSSPSKFDIYACGIFLIPKYHDENTTSITLRAHSNSNNYVIKHNSTNGIYIEPATTGLENSTVQYAIFKI